MAACCCRYDTWTTEDTHKGSVRRLNRCIEDATPPTLRTPNSNCNNPPLVSMRNRNVGRHVGRHVGRPNSMMGNSDTPNSTMGNSNCNDLVTMRNSDTLKNLCNVSRNSHTPN